MPALVKGKFQTASGPIRPLMREFGFRAASARQIEILRMEPLGNDRKAVKVVEYIEASEGQVGTDYIPDPDQEASEK